MKNETLFNIKIMKLEKLLFVHIPKTAGLSLNHELKNVFGKHYSIRFGDHTSVQKFRILSRDEIKKYNYITGHIPLQQFRDKGIDYPVLTIIRDPVDRFLSMYQYLLESTHPDHRNLNFTNIEDFIKYVKQNKENNVQCQFIGGDQICFNTLKKIKKEKIYVVPLIYFDDMIESLSKILPEPIQNIKINQSSNSKLKQNTESKEIIETQLKSYLEQDYELCKIVTQEYTQIKSNFFACIEKKW
jgi:hypothetical protein